MKLHRKLSLFSLVVFGIGIIIGAGIYSVIGVSAGHAGDSLWVSFVLAGCVALLTALSYCELSSLFPKIGSEYVYLKHAHPKAKWLSFLMGYLLALTGALTAATVATAFGGYFQVFVQVPRELSAFLLLVTVTAINLFGIENSSRANLILTSLEVLGLLLVVFFGWSHLDKLPPFALNAGTISASALIFFVYLGFEDLANLTEEANKPLKDIPRAILLSLLITTLLYICVAIGMLSLDSKELSESQFPLAYAISIYAPNLMKLVGVIALFSTANTALISLLAKSRLVFGIARSGDFPKILSRQTKTHRIPYGAALALLVISSLLLFLNDLEVLASLTSLISLVAFALVNWSLIVLRYKKPKLPRAFRAPLSIGKLPVTAVLGLITSLALLSQINSQVIVIGGAIVTVGLIYYRLTLR